MGAESPAFIEPVANRKDGIQAMFLRQSQAQSPHMKKVSKKRKRSLSPSLSHLVAEPSNLDVGQSLGKMLIRNGSDAVAPKPKVVLNHLRHPVNLRTYHRLPESVSCPKLEESAINRQEFIFENKGSSDSLFCSIHY